MAFLVYSFTLSVSLTGNGIQTQPRNVSLLVYDEGHSALSWELIRRFHPPYFRFDGERVEADEGLRRLDRGASL